MMMKKKKEELCMSGIRRSIAQGEKERAVLYHTIIEMINALRPMATTEICRLSVLAYLSPINPKMNPPSGLAKKATANTPYTLRISSSLPPVKKDLDISALKLAKTPVTDGYSR